MKFKKVTMLLFSTLMAGALAGCSLADVKSWLSENVVSKVRDAISPKEEEPKKEDSKPEPVTPEDPQGGGEQGGEEEHSEPIKLFTVKFVNYNQSILQSSKVKEGAMPEYKGQAPKKPSDARGVYTFAGWDKELVAVSEDTTYTAVYSEVLNSYTVKFVNYDGTELQSESLEYGSMPEYKGETPTREASAQYTYTFAGWDKEIAAVSGNATYTATYSREVNSYTVKFVNYDGTELQSESLEYGAMPQYKGAEPTKEQDAEHTYSFAGWDKAIVAVTGDATYTATFSSAARKYTIRFLDEDGTTVLQSSQVAYGETPSYTGETPTKAADAHYTYTFAGWDKVIAAVSGDADYVATYSASMIPLDITQEYDFSSWKFGAGEFCGTDDRSWGMPASEAHVLKYKVWNTDTFELRLPRIDFSAHPEVSMKFEGTNYHGRVTLGLDASDVTYKDGVESDRDIIGTLMFVLDGNKLYEQLSFSTFTINNVVTDADIIAGKKSGSLYVGALYDRFFNLYDIRFDRTGFVTPTFNLTSSYAGAYMKNNGSDITWNLGSDRAVGDVHYTSNADHLMYYIYDTNTFECGLPKVNFVFNKAYTMDIYAPNWNSGAKLGLSENDINYTSGNGDSVVNGQLAFVYTEGKLLGILDFGTTHQVVDVTDQDVILGNKNPVLWAKALYGRVILVSNFEVHPTGEFQLKHDWAADKMGAAMYKDGGDVTWGFGTYTTSSVLGYKVWETSLFKFAMPKINYSLTKKVTFVFHSTVWQQGVKFGLAEDDVNYSTNLGADSGGNISSLDGALEVVNNSESLAVKLTLGDTSVSISVSDSNIMNGSASLNMFVKALYDRNLLMNQIKVAF